MANGSSAYILIATEVRNFFSTICSPVCDMIQTEGIRKTSHTTEVYMEKFIPYEKLSKKEKRKLDQAKRQTWGELNPTTRKPANSRAYNRRKAQGWTKDSFGSALSS